MANHGMVLKSSKLEHSDISRLTTAFSGGQVHYQHSPRGHIRSHPRPLLLLHPTRPHLLRLRGYPKEALQVVIPCAVLADEWSLFQTHAVVDSGKEDIDQSLSGGQMLSYGRRFLLYLLDSILDHAFLRVHST